MTFQRLAIAFSLTLTACGATFETPSEPPSCAGYGFQLSVGQPLTLRFDAPTTVYVLGGASTIDGNGSEVVHVEVLSSDGTMPRVVGPQGKFPAAEVRMCRGAENVWPVAVEAAP